REAAQAEAARKVAQAEAARAEAARADAARRKAQVEAARSRDAGNNARPPSPQAPINAKAKPPAALPKIELLAKSETASAMPRPPAPRPRPAPAGGAVVGRYALQENANALRDYYRSQNVRVAIEQITANGRPMYQVRIWR
ncbi:MAG TPA: hypothetical protein PKY50_16060, partial [Candidatus Competibacter sp.]|nr:hypothetical protein [Candidatus Competibacter sp.]